MTVGIRARPEGFIISIALPLASWGGMMSAHARRCALRCAPGRGHACLSTSRCGYSGARLLTLNTVTWRGRTNMATRSHALPHQSYLLIAIFADSGIRQLPSPTAAFAYLAYLNTSGIRRHSCSFSTSRHHIFCNQLAISTHLSRLAH